MAAVLRQVRGVLRGLSGSWRALSTGSCLDRESHPP